MSGRRYLLVVSRDAPLSQAALDEIAAGTRLLVRFHAGTIALFTDDVIRADAAAMKTRQRARGDRQSTPVERGVHWLRGRGLSLIIDQHATTLAREPAGAIACYWCQSARLVLIASDPKTLARTGFWSPAIDWGHLAFTFYAAALPSIHTCLAGCLELLPGFALEINARAPVVPFSDWSPWDYVGPTELSEPDEVSHLGQAIIACVGQAATPFDHVLVSASGGLDSSIVAAALVANGKRVTCFTLATSEADGDERVHARALAKHLRVELIERRYCLEDIDLDRAVAPELARPISRTHEQSYDRQAAAVAAMCGADVRATGHGGDAVFCLTQSAVALTDRLLVHGGGRRSWTTLVDIARLTGAGAAPVLRMALRKLRRHQRGYRWRPDRLFLNADLVAGFDQTGLSHPWLTMPSGGLPGRAVHIAMLLRMQQAVEDHGAARIIHPLMSRALLERVLAIPTWRWVEGGVDRAVARQAFASRLPVSVLGRRIKGGPDSFGVELIEHHRAAIAERLLDGRLARAMLIDRAAVEQALRRFGPGQRLHHVRLLQLLEAENWIGHWASA